MDEFRKNEKYFLDRLPEDKQFISVLGLRETFFRTYNFDSKDGENTTLKAFHTAKATAIVGTWLSSYDILGISHCKTIPTVFARWGAYAGPAEQNTVLGSRCSFYFAIAAGLYSECRRHGIMIMDARPNKEYGFGFNHYSRQYGMPAEKKTLPEVY